MSISDKELLLLREAVKERMSEKRYQHTLGVERMAEYLASHLIPDRIYEARAAALLHDVAKEIPIEEQVRLLKEDGFLLTEEDLGTPGVIHSFSGATVIKRDFPEFATDDILKSVRFHTIGGRDMNIFHKIVFVSDYTEDTRVYESCIAVRGLLLKGFEELDYEGKIKRLNEACHASLQGTISAIIKAGRPINSRITGVKDAFLN